MTVENINLYSHFYKQFSQYAGKVALETIDGKSIRYKDIDQESARLASFLTGLGVVPGDRVSAQVAKSPQALCLYLACLRAGFVFHPLNTGYKSSELSYFLGNAEPTVVICDESSKDDMQPLADEAGVRHLLTLNADGSGTLMEGSASADSEFTTVNRETDDLAALLYSSGTTGVPKGIMLSHENLLRNAQSLVNCWDFTCDDVLIHALPVFHVHGLFVALGCVFLSGASMRWLNAYDTNQVINMLPGATVMMGVPTYYTRLLGSDRFTGKLVSNMRLFVSGSAPLLIETFNEFEQRTGHRILERYGMTETNMNTSNPLDGERRGGTVGVPLPGVEVRVVDDQNQPVSTDDVGNVQVRGGNVFKGYWKMPEKTEEDFTSDGFFNTGDKGKIDQDGYVTIVGRAKDMVISGGLNVYPKEVELLIDEIPEIKESAVIGVPHSDFGEGVVAVVVPENSSDTIDEEQVISTLKSELASFKVPKRVISLVELPRNTMGKVQKNVLREQFKDSLVE